MLAKIAGEKFQSLRNEMTALSDKSETENLSAEEVARAKALQEELSTAKKEYDDLKAIDVANEERKRAQEAEQKVVHRPPLIVPKDKVDLDDTEQSRKSFSQAFLESQNYKNAIANGNREFRVEIPDLGFRPGFGAKAAGDPITATLFGTRDTDLRLTPYAFVPTNIIPLIPVTNTTSTNIRYYQMGTLTGAGNWVAEGAVKPEVQIRPAPVDAPIETIADWTAATLQSLDDVPQLRAMIDFDLRRSIEVKLDNSLLNGSGTTPEIRGILQFSGVQSVAFVATTTIPDMVAKGIAAVAATGYGMPNAIVLNPADWWAVRTSKNANGVYQWGMPTEVGIPSIWGIPVVVSNAIAAGLALVGDFSYSMFYQRLGITFITGLKNDDLIKNQVTIVCEMRGTLALRRPQAFAKVALV